MKPRCVHAWARRNASRALPGTFVGRRNTAPKRSLALKSCFERAWCFVLARRTDSPGSIAHRDSGRRCGYPSRAEADDVPAPEDAGNIAKRLAVAVNRAAHDGDVVRACGPVLAVNASASRPRRARLLFRPGVKASPLGVLAAGETWRKNACSHPGAKRPRRKRGFCAPFPFGPGAARRGSRVIEMDSLFMRVLWTVFVASIELAPVAGGEGDTEDDVPVPAGLDCDEAGDDPRDLRSSLAPRVPCR